MAAFTRANLKIKIFLVLLLVLLPQAALASEYTMSDELRPICIERNKLLKIVTEIYNQWRQINGTAIPTEGYVELGSDERLVKLRFPVGNNDFKEFPEISYKAQINFMAKGGSISEVDITCTDASRRIKIVGSDNLQVSRLMKVIKEELQPYEKDAAGPNFRIVFYLIVILFYSIAVSSIWPVLIPLHEPFYWATNFFICLAFVLIPPWPTIFPGFTTSVGCKPLLDAYSTLFIFLGLVIAVLALILEVIKRLKEKDRIKRSQQ